VAIEVPTIVRAKPPQSGSAGEILHPQRLTVEMAVSSTAPDRDAKVDFA
jgi:hypothetical protein